MQQWRRAAAVPWRLKVLALAWVLHHHLLRSTSWFVLALGALTAVLLLRKLAPAGLDGRFVYPLAQRIASILTGMAALLVWAVERRRCAPPLGWRGLAALAGELAAWAALPLLTLVLMALPGLQAQTQMLFGRWLTYRRTPKGRAIVQ